MYNESILKRFWDKVKVGLPDECWEWQAGKYSTGYGTFQTYIKKICLSHRVSWEIANNSPIPGKMHVLHKCDNPSCVNPNHLFLGTHQDNMRDMFQKNRWFHATKERHGKHKLTLEQVREIRFKYQTAKTSYRKLAREYGITNQAIEAIINNRHWKE